MKPAAPGYQKVRIAPQPFNLTWASGIVPTQQGAISVSWRVTDAGTLDVQVDAPPGCEVEVVLPELAH